MSKPSLYQVHFDRVVVYPVARTNTIIAQGVLHPTREKEGKGRSGLREGNSPTVTRDSYSPAVTRDSLPKGRYDDFEHHVTRARQTAYIRAGLAKKRYVHYARPAFSQPFGNSITPKLAASSVTERAARLPTLEFLESDLISSRKLRKTRLPSSANTEVCTKVRQTISLIRGVNVPQGMAKRSISSPSVSYTHLTLPTILLV